MSRVQLDLHLQARSAVAMTDVSSKSHIDTPAWQSFEMRMRIRAAQHRAAKRRRRMRYAALTVLAASAVLAAGWWISTQPVEREIRIETPAPSRAPRTALLASAEPVPSPFSSGAIGLPVDAEILQPAIEEPEQAVAETPARDAVQVPPPRPSEPMRVAAREEPVDTSARDIERTSRPVSPGVPDLPRPAVRDSHERTMAAVIPPVAAAPPEVVPEPARPSEAPAFARTPAATPTSIDPLPRGVDVTELRASVRGTIERYRSAYERLDAVAAQSVWPGVDAGALSRAFGSLESQQLMFEDCAIDVAGSTADATCTGRASVVPKIGGGRQSVNRTWRFRLEQAGESWTIASATVR